MSIQDEVERQRNRWYALFAQWPTELYVDLVTYDKIRLNAHVPPSLTVTGVREDRYLGLRLYCANTEQRLIRVAGEVP